MIGGTAAGLWERSTHGRRLAIRVTPVRRLTRDERSALQDEADRIGAFLGLEPELTVA